MPRPAVQLEIARAEGVPTKIRIDRTPYTIGSEPKSDLHLPLAGIKPCHARVVCVGGIYLLLPEPGAPAPLVDGVPVGADGVALVHGARIEIGLPGDLSLRFLEETALPREGEERLVTLMEIARTLTASLNLDEVLDRVLEGAVRFSGAQRGYLFLREGDRLIPWRQDEAQPNVEVSLSVAEEVARTGRPVYRDRLQDTAGQSTTDSIVRLRLQAILCLPLAVRKDVIGVVYLDSKRHLRHQQLDLPLLEAFAGLAAIAIQNSRLVEERLRAERTLAIGQMARAIVHDLRAPLTAIRAVAELLRIRGPEGDPSHQHLGTIISEVDRLTGLTGDLLQFSRQAPPLERVEVRLADLVRQALTPYKARLQRENIRLDLTLEEEALVTVDATRLQRALHNLVANSLDAMRSGGTLAISCKRSNGRCLLTVRDTGCGMSDAVRRKIFEPFFTHGKTHGTGLGMAIVRSVVEEHRGSIRVECSPGAGTTVRLDLPIHPE